MNSPYKNKFKVTQEYEGSVHDGLDLVGIDDKNIYSTVSGVVERANYENASNKKQGFGLYVRIRDSKNDCYYFGHLSKCFVKVGQTVTQGDKIGFEGNTGKSTGSHLHYCCRSNASKSKIKNISSLSGIPNKIGIYTSTKEKYYLVKKSWKNVLLYKTKYISQARIFAKNKKCVVYDESGKTIYNFRGD